nr:unnamed protein product [Digitaria exilis]
MEMMGRREKEWKEERRGIGAEILVEDLRWRVSSVWEARGGLAAAYNADEVAAGYGESGSRIRERRRLGRGEESSVRRGRWASRGRWWRISRRRRVEGGGIARREQDEREKRENGTGEMRRELAAGRMGMEGW